MNVDLQISLDTFVPRWYQAPILDAIENKGYRRVMAILPRRAGKDITAWDVIKRQAVIRPGLYWYLLPTYAQGKKVIADGMTNDGKRFMDYFPKELVASYNSQEMKLKLINNSIIQIVGTDNVDTLVGANPIGCVFSEYALQDPRAYQFIRPMLDANDGWALFISTPRGKNHMWELWNIAQSNPKQWFSYRLTVEETAHVSLEDIRESVRMGEMSEDLVQQEWFCSFELGVEGSIYGKQIDRMKLEGRIGIVPWETSAKVSTAWDIGRDTTAIIWFQVIGQVIRIIDYYEKAQEDLAYFAKIILEKPYIYHKHFGPHDIGVTEWGSGISRIEKGRSLGLRFSTRIENNRIRSSVPQVSLDDGIEHLRAIFPKLWIDQQRCSQLIKNLENYRREFDPVKKTYKSTPLHSYASHCADAARYMALALPQCREGTSSEELDKRFAEARYGNQLHLPPIFKDRQ